MSSPVSSPEGNDYITKKCQLIKLDTLIHKSQYFIEATPIPVKIDYESIDSYGEDG